ncbi:hypothetical protein WLZ34_01875 [Thermogladius sp. KZ2Tp1]|uniref:hypothetical protein n=1 Tax=Thermogladius sp. KZ2Tp1 TaxID=3136289 RepID=UPI003DA96B1E
MWRGRLVDGASGFRCKNCETSTLDATKRSTSQRGVYYRAHFDEVAPGEASNPQHIAVGVGACHVEEHV